MSIEVVSNTDSPREVAQSAQPKSEKVSETQSASEPQAQDEIKEESETSEENEENETNEEGKEQLDAKNKTRGADKKIKKLVRKLSEKDQEIELWKKEALKGKSQDAETNKPQEKLEAKAPAVSEKPKSPRMADFNTMEEYEAARDDYQEKLSDWKIADHEKQKEQKAKEAEVKSSFEKQQLEFSKKVDEFRKTVPDYDDFVEVIGDVMLNPSIISRMEKTGPEVAYQLYKHDQLDRINALEPIEAAVELGIFLAGLGSSSEQKNKQEQKIIASKAPSPISPLGNKGSSVMKKSLDDPSLSFAEYEKLRMQQQKKK